MSYYLHIRPLLLLICYFPAFLYAQDPQLPNLSEAYETYQELGANGDFLGLARFLAQTNQTLQAGEIHLMTAKAFLKANHIDSAFLFTQKAIQAGSINPNFLEDYGLGDLKDSPYGPQILQQLDQQRASISSVEDLAFRFDLIYAFYDCFDQIRANPDQADEYLSRYILSDPGLREFYVKRYYSLAAMKKAYVKENTAVYEYQRALIDTSRIIALEKATKKRFARIKELYPETVFPPTFFVMGVGNTGGTVSPAGLFIGTERLLWEDVLPDSMKKYAHNFIGKPEDILPGLITHELMHFQQKYRDTTHNLLGACINEGVADFLADLSTGTLSEQDPEEYFYQNEAKLWDEFQQDWKDDNYDNWLYNGGSIKDRPGDLGYKMGYVIARAYYEKQADKKAAIRELLTTDSFQRVLEESGYAKQFE